MYVHDIVFELLCNKDLRKLIINVEITCTLKKFIPFLSHFLKEG